MRERNPTFHASVIRPAFVDFAAHDAIKAYIPPQRAVMNIMTAVLGPPVRAIAKGSCSPTEYLGKFMTEMAMGKWEGEMKGEGIDKLGQFSIVNNVGFRRLAGLS